MKRMAAKRVCNRTVSIERGENNMISICGTECCKDCPRLAACGGCEQVDGHPFGGVCVAAEWVKNGGLENLARQKDRLVKEVNALGVKGLQVDDLYYLSGCYVNLEYRLPNGASIKLLEDNKVYLGNQIEIPGTERCHGVVGDAEYLLVCAYGSGGSDPEIIVYRKRNCEVEGA